MADEQPVFNINDAFDELDDIPLGEEGVGPFQDFLDEICAHQILEQHDLLLQAIKLKLDTLGVEPDVETLRRHDEAASHINRWKREAAN